MVALKLPKREMVFDRSLGKLRPIGERPRLSSAHLPWQGVLLEEHAQPSVDARDVIWTNHVVILLLRPAVTVEFKSGSGFVPRRVLPGQFSFRPYQSCSSARSSEPAEFLTLSLAPTFLAMACCEFADADRLELPPLTAAEDRFVEGVCLALRREVEQGGSLGRLYGESLATSLAVHLALKYGSRKAAGNGLSAAPVPGVVRRAVEFIHERLTEDIGLEELAAHVGLSRFHFARTFKQSTGISPHQFVIRQRLERAKHLLLRGEHSMAEAAAESGFYDQSHFILHFKRHCGMTPRAFVESCCPRARPAEALSRPARDSEALDRRG